MLSVTDGALEHLATVLANPDVPDGTVIRCVVEGENLALVTDAEEPGDVIFQHEERTVLVVAKDLSDALDGREFDVDATEEGTGLMLR
jgi:Fe-S cluster assembly iron-binding protein IscA